MKNLKKFLFFFISIGFTSTYLFADDKTETRVERLIQKSKNTRDLVEKDQSKNRDPASLRSNYTEFEKLMNDQTEQSWLDEVERLTAE